jgi:hypothetical protein
MRARSERHRETPIPALVVPVLVVVVTVAPVAIVFTPAAIGCVLVVGTMAV